MLKQERKDNLSIKLISFVIVALVIFSLFFGIGVGGKAYADTNMEKYSGVLDDLQKDESFNAAAYPVKDGDYSLQVIQIAESTAGELFLYVYQPCANTRELTATYVNMSLTDKLGGIVNDDAALTDSDKPKLYGLTLINRGGVFGKYKVNDFTVSKEAVRYYNIVSIYRDFNADYGDTGSSEESILTGKAFDVGKLYIAKTVNGQIDYECQEKKTVLIKDPFFDYLEYTNGFKFSPDWCRSHYIAFSTDWKIDFLKEADVSYVATPYGRSTGLGLSGEATPQGDPVPHENETIKYKMTGENAADGWFSKKYVWDRIESVDDFIKNEDLKDSTKENLKGKQWVIRFTETTIKLYSGFGSTTTFWTEIDDVTVLRLKFVTNGVTYNLGAVSDMGHSDNNPGNNNTNELDFWGWLERLTGIPAWVWKLIIALIPIIILLPILSAIFPVVGQVLKSLLMGVLAVFKYLFVGLWFVITLPFRGIAAVIKKLSDRPKANSLGGGGSGKKLAPKKSAKPKAKKSGGSKLRSSGKAKKQGTK